MKKRDATLAGFALLILLLGIGSMGGTPACNCAPTSGAPPTPPAPPGKLPLTVTGVSAGSPSNNASGGKYNIT